MRKVDIALLGCGTVGRGFVHLVDRNRDRIRERHGIDLRIATILVRDSRKEREGIDRALITSSRERALDRPHSVVVELVGGATEARSYIREALFSRRDVVTANKAVLAVAGRDLLELAEVHRVRLGFEASVCGAVPIIRVLRGALSGDRVERIDGIVNGTSNFILTRMTEGSMSLEEALREAQRRGFAESDATLDLDGSDAAQKLTILAELAFDRSLPLKFERIEGITAVDQDVIRRALEKGRVIRLVASAWLDSGAVRLEVRPREVEQRHPLGEVRDENNGVLIRCEAAGELFFAGKGAGSLPTAGAVLADVIELAKSA